MRRIGMSEKITKLTKKQTDMMPIENHLSGGQTALQQDGAGLYEALALRHLAFKLRRDGYK